MIKHVGASKVTLHPKVHSAKPIDPLPHPPACDIRPVGKRRDGGTRYWCLRHKADATAKYGKPASVCRAPLISEIPSDQVVDLNMDEYAGGVGLWGAVPPVFDTTEFPMERGIHVHARGSNGAKKSIDRSFASVRIFSSKLPSEGLVLSEVDAIYYMASTVLGHEMRGVSCTYCGHSHLDKDYFSVHPHRRHLCAACGRHFQDSSKGIGNPICAIRDACGIEAHKPVPANRSLDIRQRDYPGGIQIWGTNPAIIWTRGKEEEDGIHVHAYAEGAAHPCVDETYSDVVIDGFKLDPLMVRLLMAQMTLPSLKGRVKAIECPSCHEAQFDFGESSFTPVAIRDCASCSTAIPPKGRYRKNVASPLIGILEGLSALAVRTPQTHDLGLRPEAL